MALSLVDVGTTANDGTGDPLRTAFQTVNTALTAVNNAVVVGTGTTTFKDDSGTYGVAVASNGDVTFTNAGATVGMTWDASANTDVGGLGIGTTSPSSAIHIAVDNTNNNGQILVVQSGTGDATARFAAGGTAWIAGIDNSNGDGFGIQQNTSINSSAEMFITTAGLVGIGTTSPTEKLDVNGDAIRIRTSQTPASAAATGDAGMVCWDASYIYVCTATNTWKRAAIATW